MEYLMEQQIIVLSEMENSNETFDKVFQKAQKQSVYQLNQVIPKVRLKWL